MASQRSQRHFAFVLSILGHAAIVAALTFSIPLAGPSEATGSIVIPIETVLIDEAAIEAEIARIEAAEEVEREREREQQRVEAERLRREQAERQQELERVQRERDEAERVADQERERLLLLEQEREERERQAEIARQEELEQRRIEAERLAAEQAAEAERLRQEAERAARLAEIEAEVARSIAAEQADRQARDAGLRDQWARAIETRVMLQWNRPLNAVAGLDCVLEVTQLPNGEVINVAIGECNTSDQTIIRSIENAVLNASPLPEPPRGVAFERVVRITFRPTE